MTRIVATADLHGTLPQIPECDLLLIAGDVCPVWDHERRFQARWLRTDFSRWLESVPAKTIVGIGGNHDFVLNDGGIGEQLPWTYLVDSECEAFGLKIWGSPMSPRFGNWAFMRDDRGLAEVWEKIPTDVDILMIHGPMYGVGDLVPYQVAKAVQGDDGKTYWEYTAASGEHVGSQTLRNRMDYTEFPNLKLFVFGHIHEGYGLNTHKNFECANVSLMDGRYEPNNPVMEFELDEVE